VSTARPYGTDRVTDILHPSAGKFLLLAALFKCLDPALTIAATLNSKSPFVVPFGREQEADTVKQSFKKGEWR
jgi:HrpA-like RNA helicase